MRSPFVHELFSAMATRFPRAIAIERGDDRVTYEALDRTAEALAARLLNAGARKGDPVVVVSENRVSVVAALIGILKANCAFVPLSPELPDRRVQQLLSQCAPKLTLSDSAHARRMVDLCAGIDSPVEIIPLDAVDGATQVFAAAGSERPTPEPDDLSYIVFTSGSTGEPKPIAGRLKAIDHFIRWEIDTFELQAVSASAS